MNHRSVSFIRRFLASKFGTPIAVLILVITLNSTLLLLSQLLQQSSSRNYHHGEGRSFMSVNIASRHEGDHHDSKSSASSILDAVSSSRVSLDNIAGANMEEVMSFKTVDIVYTWVNGSDPRHAKGSFSNFFHFIFISQLCANSFSTPLVCSQELLKLKLKRMTHPNGTGT